MVRLLAPFKFRLLWKQIKNENFYLLDIGCGTHSPGNTKRWFPKCYYHGLDCVNYGTNPTYHSLITTFYHINLENESIEEIPDDFFDAVILSHVIEHLTNGTDVVSQLCSKVKKGGYIYIEYPSVSSLRLPSLQGTLNFCDDESHIRIYDLKEIANTLLGKQFKIIRGGQRRDWTRIPLIPILLLLSYLRDGRVSTVPLWDLFPFAEFVFARRR